MTNHQDRPTAVVTTAVGTIQGRWLDDIARFAAIPYAESPTGERRFRPPVTKARWDGVFDATEFGPICPQNPSFMDMMFGLSPEPQDEDCLRLNVFTPDPTLRDDAALPVMVWIHGGAFEMGSGSTDIYDGSTFARQGVVFVSINYRLGPLGFLELGGLDPNFVGSGNAGLLDQIEALRWVNNHIANFGGDAERVTVFGESAGSMSTALLMSAPSTKGLMHRAICQSGGINAGRDLALAQREADDVMRHGGWASVTDAQNAPIESILAVHAAMSAERWGNPDALLAANDDPMTAMAFRPVRDGVTLPFDPLEAIRAGAAAGVDLVAGHNLDEWKLFAMLMPSSQDDDELRRRAALIATDDTTDELLSAYRADHPEAGPADLECAIVTDVVFRVPVVDLIEAQSSHASVWQYQFDWRSPFLGAAHAVELPFVFAQLHDTRLAPLFGPEPPHHIAEAMSTAWANFAIDGAPTLNGELQWPAVESGRPRPVLRFDVAAQIDTDPLATSLRYWRS